MPDHTAATIFHATMRQMWGLPHKEDAVSPTLKLITALSAKGDTAKVKSAVFVMTLCEAEPTGKTSAGGWTEWVFADKSTVWISDVRHGASLEAPSDAAPSGPDTPKVKLSPPTHALAMWHEAEKQGYTIEEFCEACQTAVTSFGKVQDMKKLSKLLAAILPS